MIEFEFEKDVEAMLPSLDSNEFGNFRLGDQKHRIIVCRHWLLGLCHNGNSCSYLHRLDKSKMPPCKHGNMCKIKNCPLKHLANEELDECLFYKQGFCCSGPKCIRRHVKRMPEECPLEAAFETSNFTQLQSGKKSKTNQPNDNFKVTLCTHWLQNGACPFNDECHFAHGEDEINEGFQTNSEYLEDSEVYDPTAYQLNPVLDLMFPLNSRCSFFILQSPDLRSLNIAKRRGVWSVPTRLAQEMNAALRSSEHVVIYFSVRPLRGIYGVAKMAGPISPVVSPLSPLTPEFPIQWLRTLRISLHTIAQLKMGNSGMFVGRSTSDGRFENKVGMDLLLISCRKPVWDWSAEIEKAESGIRLVPCGNAVTNEYFPVNGQSAYYLHPDVLFAQDWVERAAAQDKLGPVNRFPVQGSGTLESGLGATFPPVDFYTGALGGFVFCATPPVIEEMFGRFLLGLPLQMKDVVIHPNVPLFIFDTHAQVLLGVFHPDSPTTIGLDPTAFVDWSSVNATGLAGAVSALPVQLKFRIALEAPPISVHDPELQLALGSFGKSLGGPLPALETKNVANLFARRVVGVNSASSTARGAAVGFRGGQNSAPGNGLYYKPPFKYVGTVYIDLPGSIYEIKKRLLGNNASIIMGLVDSLGSKHSIRVRMRGIGSGFTEGPTNSELPEPLQFSVSAESEALLQSVMISVQGLVDKNRMEMQLRQ